MAIDIQILVTKDALPTVTVNPRDLATGPEETMFLDYTWFTFGPLDANGTLLTRNNANQGAAIAAWARHMLRNEYRSMVNRERLRVESVARNAVSDFTVAVDE